MRISNYFRTFAAGFGIVQAVTIKHTKLMANKCIYKVQAGNALFKVETRRTRAGKLYFVVMERRRLTDFPFSYDNVMDAVGRANSLAGRVIYKLNADGFEV